MVVVDDYSKFTWVEFIRQKSETKMILPELILKVQNEQKNKVVRIKLDNRNEFCNGVIMDFCVEQVYTTNIQLLVHLHKMM